VTRVLMVLFVLSTPAAVALNCGDTAVLDGYLTQARIQCRFDHFSERFQRDAATCYKRFSKDQVAEMFSYGVGLFANEVRIKDLQVACEQATRRYPNVIGPDRSHY
jgi:hypothetical protein